MHFLMAIENGIMTDVAARYTRPTRVQKLRGARMHQWWKSQLTLDDTCKVIAREKKVAPGMAQPPAMRMAGGPPGARFSKKIPQEYKTIKVMSMAGGYVNLPASKVDFRDSEYILQSQIKKGMMLTNKRPIAIWKGERVFKRSQTVELKTVAQWKKEKRIIKPDQQPRQPGLYSEDQTEELVGDAPSKKRRKIGSEASSSKLSSSSSLNEPILDANGNEIFAIGDKRRRATPAADKKWLETWASLNDFVEDTGFLPRPTKECLNLKGCHFAFNIFAKVLHDCFKNVKNQH